MIGGNAGRSLSAARRMELQNNKEIGRSRFVETRKGPGGNSRLA